MKLGAIHKTGKFINRLSVTKKRFLYLGTGVLSCYVLCNILFFLQHNTVSFALSLERSPRVPPKMKRVKIEEKESEQPTGTIHEMQQRSYLPGK